MLGPVFPVILGTLTESASKLIERCVQQSEGFFSKIGGCVKTYKNVFTDAFLSFFVSLYQTIQ